MEIRELVSLLASTNTGLVYISCPLAGAKVKFRVSKHHAILQLRPFRHEHITVRDAGKMKDGRRAYILEMGELADEQPRRGSQQVR